MRLIACTSTSTPDAEPRTNVPSPRGNVTDSSVTVGRPSGAKKRSVYGPLVGRCTSPRTGALAGGPSGTSTAPGSAACGSCSSLVEAVDVSSLESVT